MTITKNRQSSETISRMAEAAFPDKHIADIKELTEGMCNVTYSIAFTDGSESILKNQNFTNEVEIYVEKIWFNYLLYVFDVGISWLFRKI